MNKEQVIVLLYDLSDEYIAANYNKNANDVSYYLGLKDGIEGFRRHMLYYLKHYCEWHKRIFKRCELCRYIEF